MSNPLSENQLKLALPLGTDLPLAPGLTWLIGDEGTGKTTCLLRWAAALEVAARFAPDALGLPQDNEGVTDYFLRQQQRYPTWHLPLQNDLTAEFGLSPHLGKQVYMLSAGTRRKLYLVAAFAARAPLTLLDQPFAALDKPSIALLHELLQEAAQDTQRAWVVADYEVPSELAGLEGFRGAKVIELPLPSA